MGIEHFHTELVGGSVPYPMATAVVGSLPHVRPDPDGGFLRQAYFALSDGWHFIEIEVDEGPVRVSLRFTLCHPPSGLDALLAHARDLMARLGMNAVLIEGDDPATKREYTLAEFDTFAELNRRAYPARKAEWVAMFGPEEAGVDTAEAFARFILPTCVPASPAASTAPAARPPAAPAR